jgi:hypothetical protein
VFSYLIYAPNTNNYDNLLDSFRTFAHQDVMKSFATGLLHSFYIPLYEYMPLDYVEEIGHTDSLIHRGLSSRKVRALCAFIRFAMPDKKACSLIHPHVARRRSYDLALVVFV